MNKQIVIYANGEIEVRVAINKDSIWLTQKQIAHLFGTQIPAISKHIKKIFSQNELIEKMVVSKMEITTKHGALKWKKQTKIINIYNLDMILAIGYRVNSIKAIHFRKWATKVLKKYISDGYVINSEKITHQRFKELEYDVSLLKQKVKLLGNNKELKKQGIFFNGQIFDAYKFISDLIRKAKKEIILIDNYIDDTVLILFDKRKKGVKVKIYTKRITKQMQLDIDKYNSQYPHIDIKEIKNMHDRFIIIDKKEIYHIGASLKDLGKKVFAFSILDKEIIKYLGKLGIK